MAGNRSGMPWYTVPDINAPSPIPISRKIKIVATPFPLLSSGLRSMVQAKSVGEFRPYPIPKKNAPTKNVGCVVLKPKIIILIKMMVVLNFSTAVLPKRSESLPPMTRTSSELEVKTMKKKSTILDAGESH